MTTTSQPATPPGYAEATARVLAQLVQLSDPAQLHPEVRLFLDLGLTSSNALELVMQLEDELGLELKTQALDWHHLETLGALIAYVSAAASHPDRSAHP